MTRFLHTGTFICVAFLAVACLSGCGRRGALEAPPEAVAPAASAEPPAAGAAAGASMKPSSRRTKKIVPPKRDTPLDWLL